MRKTRRDLAETIEKLLEQCIAKNRAQTFEGLSKIVSLINDELGHKEDRCFSVHYDNLDEPVGYTHGRSVADALLNLSEDDEEVREVKSEDCGLCNDKD